MKLLLQCSPLPRSPTSSGPIKISPCIWGSCFGKPLTLQDMQRNSGWGRQTSLPAAGLSPQLPAGIPGLLVGQMGDWGPGAELPEGCAGAGVAPLPREG